MKNSADQWKEGVIHTSQRPKAEVDNTFRDLQNSSYPTKAVFSGVLARDKKWQLPCLKLHARASERRFSNHDKWKQYFNELEEVIKTCLVHLFLTYEEANNLILAM